MSAGSAGQPADGVRAYRERLGRVVHQARAVWAECPDQDPDWTVAWERLAPVLRAECIAIGTAVAGAEHLRSSNAEWLCTRCNVIHPPPPGCKFGFHCPGCGEFMIPTSPAGRMIDELEAELAAIRWVLGTRDLSEVASAVTRLEVTGGGLTLVRRGTTVGLSLHDSGRTLKVVMRDR